MEPACLIQRTFPDRQNSSSESLPIRAPFMCRDAGGANLLRRLYINIYYNIAQDTMSGLYAG